MRPHSLDELLAAAATLIDRLGVDEASAELAAGAVLVDTRSSDERTESGVVPGALHIPRTVLEWRLEPDGEHRSPFAPAPGAA